MAERSKEEPMAFYWIALSEVPQRSSADAPEIGEAELLPQLQSGAEVSDQVYAPSYLRSNYAPLPHRVENVTFRRVSFSQTQIENFEFTGCVFDQCLFTRTIFRNCRFRLCNFINTNFWRSEFDGCFADPSQFDQCLPIRRYENIGVHLFQQLLKNSRLQAQPDFADEAQYRFRKWQRYQLRAEMLASESILTITWHFPEFVIRWMFDFFMGSGMRLRRLSISCLGVLFSFTLLNWSMAGEFGLQGEGQVISRLADAFYVTTVIMTTLGFGDITPCTTVGRVVISVEAITGFVLFAFLTSSLYRKVSS